MPVDSLATVAPHCWKQISRWVRLQPVSAESLHLASVSGQRPPWPLVIRVSTVHDEQWLLPLRAPLAEVLVHTWSSPEAGSPVSILLIGASRLPSVRSAHESATLTPSVRA